MPDTYLSAVDGVSVNELNGLNTTAIHVLHSSPHHVQYVAVGQEVAGEVEADGQRVFVGRLVELDDSSLHLSFTDTEHSHAVHRRTDLVSVSVNHSQHIHYKPSLVYTDSQYGIMQWFVGRFGI